MAAVDKKALAKLRRQLKQRLNEQLKSMGFTGTWPEWKRKTETRQQFVHIVALKYGGGYDIAAGYTGLGDHVAAYPFVKQDLWETIAEENVEFSHTLPDCRRHLHKGKAGGCLPYPKTLDADAINNWVTHVCELTADLDHWLKTGAASQYLSKPY